MAAVAGLLTVGALGTASTTSAAEEGKVKCYGVNACKGQGACGGKGHSCAGKNSCKGQGYLEMDKDACVKQGGSLTAPESK
jgi:uncharacterized membrane protein